MVSFVIYILPQLKIKSLKKNKNKKSHTQKYYILREYVPNKILAYV